MEVKCKMILKSNKDKLNELEDFLSLDCGWEVDRGRDQLNCAFDFGVEKDESLELFEFVNSRLAYNNEAISVMIDYNNKQLKYEVK